MRLPAATDLATAAGEVFAELSPERLLDLDADVVFWLTRLDPTGLPLWPRLAGIAAGQAREITDADLRVGNSYESYRATLAFLERALQGVRNDVVVE